MSIRMRPLAWFAAALSGVNVLGTAFAAAMGEPWHAALHVGLAAGFINGIVIAYGNVVAFMATLAMLVGWPVKPCGDSG